MQLVLAQVEESVFEPELLGRRVVLDMHRDRQGFGHRLDDHLGGIELDLAGGEPGVHGGRLARHHLAAHGDHALGAHRLCNLEDRAGNIDHHLGHAIMIAQVDKQQVAVVALALDPARQAGLLADMLGPQLAARMGSVDRRHY